MAIQVVYARWCGRVTRCESPIPRCLLMAHECPWLWDSNHGFPCRLGFVSENYGTLRCRKFMVNPCFFLIWKLSYLETPGLLIFWTHTLTDRSRQMASWHPYELRSKAGSLKILYAILHLCISQNYTKCMYKAYDVRMWKDHLTDALRYDPCIQEYDMW